MMHIRTMTIYKKTFTFLLFFFSLTLFCSSAFASEITSSKSYNAKIMVSTKAYKSPGSHSVIITLKPSAPIYGGQHRLLILEKQTVDGVEWLKLRLSKRPNTSNGWVKADEVMVSENPYRVVVDISSKTVSVFKAGKLKMKTKAVVGKKSTPTPTGVFALLEVVPQPGGAKSKLGSYVYALTAHSDVHKTFDGGDGRVGIHGYEHLGNKLGTAASNGCIRVPNGFVKKLAKISPGTPLIVQK